jgi:hypothetical protein
VPDGTYQVELYINGRLAAEPAEAAVDQPELVTVDRRDMGLLFCRPADWVAGDQSDGQRATFESPDGTMGMTVARVFRPFDAVDGDQPQSVQVMSELIADWPGAPQAVEAEPVDDYFMGLADARLQWYDTLDTRVKVIAGVDNIGTVFAVAIHGPADWVDGPLSNGIMGSFSTQ